MTRAAILIALTAILVPPVSVGATSPSPSSTVPRDHLAVEVADPDSDLRTDEGEIVAGPGFMDLSSFGIRVDGDDLLLSLDVAGDLADVLSTSLVPEYGLWITLPGTNQFSWIHVVPAEDWSVARQLDIWQRDSIGTAEADGSSSSGAAYFGLWWSLTSTVIAVEAPTRFEDIQERGPFAWFRHEHRFEAVGEVTRMHDHWEHRSPFGPIGRIVDRLVLGRYMRSLLVTRNAALKHQAETP